jgi:hypothetical protein
MNAAGKPDSARAGGAAQQMMVTETAYGLALNQ